jgi:hypothetical protein
VRKTIVRAFIADFYSSLMVFLLKWLLIGLVYILGAFIGFVGWINALVIAAMEAFLHLRHLHKESEELGDAWRKVGNIPKS